MKRILLALMMLATFASAQTDSTDILIYIGKKDTTQFGRWRPGMGVIIREATDVWGSKELSLEDSLFVRLRVGVAKSRIDSFLVAHNDSTSGLRRKYQLSKAAIRFALENRDSSNVVRVTIAQLRNGFKRTQRNRHLGNPQRMGILTPDLFVRWRNMLIAPTLTSVTVNTDGGGDYTALVSAEAGENDDLVTANEQLTLNCSGTVADVSAVEFDGWTVDPTRLPIVQGDNTLGTKDLTKYHLRVTSGEALRIKIIYIKVLNLQISAATGAGNRCLYIQVPTWNGASGIEITNCYINSETSNGQAILVNSGGTGLQIVNNIIQCQADAIAYLMQLAVGTKFYNNTVVKTDGVSSKAGLSDGSTNRTIFKNNIVSGFATNYSGCTNAGNDYNLSTDSTHTGGDNDVIAAVLQFTDADNGDFGLAVGSPGIDQGVSLIAEGVTTDIKGVARPQGTAFDIGAFEFVPVSDDAQPDKRNGWNGWLNKGFKGRF